MCVIVESLSVYVISSSLFFGFRLKEHVQDPSNNPILIFPEGAYEGEKKGWGGGEGREGEEGGAKLSTVIKRAICFRVEDCQVEVNYVQEFNGSFAVCIVVRMLCVSQQLV